MVTGDDTGIIKLVENAINGSETNLSRPDRSAVCTDLPHCVLAVRLLQDFRILTRGKVILSPAFLTLGCCLPFLFIRILEGVVILIDCRCNGNHELAWPVIIGRSQVKNKPSNSRVLAHQTRHGEYSGPLARPENVDTM